MNDRLMQLRKHLRLSQEKFGHNLGVTGAGISKIESGDRGLTDTMIKLICSTYGVNENWLYSGIGEMFVTLDKTEKEDEFIASFMKEPNDIKKKIIMGLYEMDDRLWDEVIKKIKEIANDTYK